MRMAGTEITVTSSSEHDRYRTMETKDKVKYIFGQDGFLRFIEDLDGNSVKHQYGPNSAGIIWDILQMRQVIFKYHLFNG